MPIEIEKKYRITKKQHALILGRLAALRASFEGKDFEENTLFSGGTLEIGSSVLRLRRLADDGAVLTFKERLPSISEIKHQREDETRVDNPEAMEAILKTLGFRPALVYEKRRLTWRLENCEIVIDELPFGLFMEIEGDERDILKVESQLKITDLRSESATYPQLAFEHGVPNGDVVEARFEIKEGSLDRKR